MRISHIRGLLLQEYYVTLHSYEALFALIVFPSMMVAVFGFLSLYLSKILPHTVTHSLLTGIIFWQVIFVMQYATSFSTLWNVRSRNLSNMFVAPISLPEYLFAQALSGVGKAFCMFLFLSFCSFGLFHINVFSLGMLNLLFSFISLSLFGFSFGIIALGLIFRFGTRIQVVAWGMLPILQPLTAAVYPISVLPVFVQPISYLFPPTYVFEAIRQGYLYPGVQWELIGISFFLNIVYLFGGLWFFNKMFTNSKKEGQFARLET